MPTIPSLTVTRRAAGRVLALGLVTALAAAAPVAAGELTELAAAIDHPAAGPMVELGSPVRVGRGELVPASGRARLLVARTAAGGEPCGLLLGGPVRFTYRVEDRFSQPLAVRNLGRDSSRKAVQADGVVTITDSFDGAVVWGWELAAAAAASTGERAGEGAGDGGTGEPPAAGTALPRWAQEILDRPFFAPPSSELIAARRLGGRDVAYALLTGGGEPWLVAADPVDERLEGIWRLEKLPPIYELSKGRHLAHELVAQPIGRPWWEAAAPPAVAVDESIRVANTEDTLVTVQTRIRIEATRPGLGVWRVGLADRTVVDDTEAPLEVLGVTVDGQAVEVLHQGSELLVPLVPPLAAGAGATVEVVHAGHLALRPGNDSYWVLSTWPWRPDPPLGGELADVELEVDVPHPFVPFASGDTVERTSNDGRNRLRTRLGRRDRSPVVAAGKYNVYTEERDGLTCNVAAYAFGKEKEARRLAGIVLGAVDVFEQAFGHPYPYRELDVVEINDWGFGQAPAGVIFITQEAFNPLGSVTSRAYSQGVNARIVHEVAHGWWGHVALWPSWEEQWLSESFAEYTAALALQAMLGGKKGEREFSSQLHEWLNNTKRIQDGGSIFLANHLAGDTDRDRLDRIYLLYNKGPVVLHALRQELAKTTGSAEQGDRFFFALLRSFLTNFEGGWGETRHLVGILDQITGRDWQPWFERYVYGPETPTIRE